MFPKKITKFKHFQITNIDSLKKKKLLYYINYNLLENNHIILRRV